MNAAALAGMLIVGMPAIAAEIQAQSAEHEHAGHHRTFDDPQQYAKSWDDPKRDSWQKPAALVAALGVAPGMAAADIGTGTGYLLPHLSRAAGPQGRVFAVDISPEMLAWVAERARREGLANVRTVKATGGASGLLEASIDRAIMINVWHHIEDQASYARDLHRALRAGGVVFIVEARPDLEEEDGPPAHFRMQPAKVIEQLRVAGFRASVEPVGLERQYVVRGELLFDAGFELIEGELEEEVCREPVSVAADLLIESRGADAVQRGKLGVEYDPLMVQNPDRSNDLHDRLGCRSHSLRHGVNRGYRRKSAWSDPISPAPLVCNTDLQRNREDSSIDS